MHRMRLHGSLLWGVLLAATLAGAAARGHEAPTEPDDLTPPAEAGTETDPVNPEGAETDVEPAERIDNDAVPIIMPAPGFLPAGRQWRAFFRGNMMFRAAPMGVVADDDAEGQRSVVLPDNGDMRRRLEKIRTQIDGGLAAEGARQLGLLLQNPQTQDFFLRHDEGNQGGRSFRDEVREMIETLPAEGKAAYHVQFDVPARQRLIAALAEGGEAGLRETALRFPRTPAGAEAMYRLGHLLWEHGRWEAAAACFERVAGEPAEAQAFEPVLTLMRAACRHLAGDRDALPGLVGQLRASPTPPVQRLAGRPLGELLRHDDAADQLAALLGPATRPAQADWTNPRGDSSRNRLIAAGEPLLVPRWTRPVSTNPQTQLAIDRAVAAYLEGRGRFLPGPVPLAVGELVLMRTSRGVAAFDLTRGERLWNYPSDDDDNTGYERTLRNGASQGAFSADAECFYLVEDASGAERGSSQRAASVLTAREHYQSRQGRLRWQIGGSSAGVEPALAEVAFLGPPLSYRRELYVEYELKGAICLAALDVATGRLQWSQELALLDTSPGAEQTGLASGLSPSISAEEIVVCPTGGGAVVAVDLTTRSLMWAYRYAPRDETGTEPEPVEPLRMHRQPRWLDGTAAVCGRSVLLTPPESNELHCLDLANGRPRWTRPRSDGLFVGPTTGDAVLVVGTSQVRALRLSDGESAWAAPIVLPTQTLTFGRGVATSERYYLPTTAGIVTIDLARGELVETRASLRQTAPGNLIWHRGLFLSQSPTFLEAFDEQARAEREIATALEHNPLDPDSLLRRGELLSYSGRIDEALATVRQAHTLARSARSRALLTSTLLDALRRDGSDRDRLQDELDALAVDREMSAH